eukprot:6247916-Pyramimonas_sp.AAC.1
MILVTYNAETAQDTVKGERTVLRGQWLRQQFQEASALLVGAQEARTPRGSRTADDFYCMASGAEEGENFGCELW